jgi:hypothetical protein
LKGPFSLVIIYEKKRDLLYKIYINLKERKIILKI